MPFVSQAALDAMQRHLDTTREDLKEARAEIARLTDTIVQMKRQNYHPAEEVLCAPAPVMVPPSPVELAIRAKIPPRLRKGVYEEVATWRAKGMSDEAIVKRIEVGEGAA